jgi:D-glycero-alpha-D-manno-heptose-7-phosphate kinase
MILTKTPLRITFAGGGSDMASYYLRHPATCISATINKYVYVLVRKRFDDKIYLKYSENEVVDVRHIDDIQHDFIRETLKFMNVNYGVEIINWADIPTKGTGLGSSSSFLVGLLLALHTLEGRSVTKEALATQASYIEIEKCGKPIGIQDQYAAAFGGFNKMEFGSNTNRGDYKNISGFGFSDQEIRDISDHLHLFYTGVTRESKNILATQKENLISNEVVINNMHNNVDLANRLAGSLVVKDISAVPIALRQNWELKKKFTGDISNPELDRIYDVATTIGGAEAGKIIGAGGGGFFLFWTEDKKKLKEALADYQELPFIIDKYGSRIVINLEGLTW